MERVKGAFSTDPSCASLEAAYTVLVGGFAIGESERCVARSREFDRSLVEADPIAARPCVALLRARLDVTLAYLLPLDGRDATAYARRALRRARRLRGAAELPAGRAEGVIAEAHLCLCKQAASTALAALHFYQARAASRRALARDRAEPSAHLVLGAFRLHAPRAFGGSPDDAVAHLEQVLRVIPEHSGAKMLLAESYERTGESERALEIAGELEREAPSHARYLRERLLPRSGRGGPSNGGSWG